MTIRSIETLLVAILGVLATSACVQANRGSATKDIISDIGESDGSIYHYKVQGQILTRARCQQPSQQPCDDNKQSVNYERFKREFAVATADASEERRIAVYALLESPVALRIPATGDLLTDLHPLLAKLGESFDQTLGRLVAIVAGRYHTCSLSAGDKAYCWGDGQSGKLGNGGTSSKHTPTAVSGDLIFSSLTAGGSHTCGMTEGGKAYCWGYGEMVRDFTRWGQVVSPN